MSACAPLIKRFKVAKKRKANWITLYKDALDYAAPNNQVFDQTVEGQSKSNSNHVFDSTASIALDGFVSNIQSSLFPPTRNWIRLACGFAVQQNKREELDAALTNTVQIMFDALRVSNFDSQISTSLADLAFGVGMLMVHKGTRENPFVFSSVNIAQIHLEEGPHGRTDSNYREFEIEVRNIQDTWPDAKLHKKLTDTLKDKPETKIKIVEACIADKIDYIDKKGKSEKILGYRYYVMDTSNNEMLLERGQRSSPFIPFRWLTLANELYARGPMIKALPDIKTINKVQELILKKGSRDLYGMYTYLDDGVINIDNIRFDAMGFIPVEYNGGNRGPSIMPLPPAGDPGQYGQFIFRDLQNKIFKALFAEPLGAVDAPVKTATEVAYRQQELAKKIGAAFGKLQYELVVPLVNRLLHILEELDLVDLSGYRVDGQNISIKYMSPLAQAQDEDEVQAAIRYAVTLRDLYGPQVMMALVPPDRMSAFLADKLHVPADIRATEDEINIMKQAIVMKAAQEDQPSAPPGGLPVESEMQEAA